MAHAGPSALVVTGPCQALALGSTALVAPAFSLLVASVWLLQGTTFWDIVTPEISKAVLALAPTELPDKALGGLLRQLQVIIMLCGGVPQLLQAVYRRITGSQCSQCVAFSVCCGCCKRRRVREPLNDVEAPSECSVATFESPLTRAVSHNRELPDIGEMHIPLSHGAAERDRHETFAVLEEDMETDLTEIDDDDTEAEHGSYRALSGEASLSGSFIDAAGTVADLRVFVSYFCTGFSFDAAVKLADEGLMLWRQCCPDASSTSESSTDTAAICAAISENPCRSASALVWALMREAIFQRQGFHEGTFVVHGPGADLLFFALLPFTYDRASSHFKKTVLPLTAEDAERLPEGPMKTEVEARFARGCVNVGLDVPADGSQDLPSGKQHVVLGRIQQHDGSVAMYFKMEAHGFDLTSPQKVTEAAWHAVHYINSQVQRHLGDRREHDEGELKRKEYVPMKEAKDFDRLVEGLGCATANEAVHRFGLGEMARALRRLEDSEAEVNEEQREGARAMLRDWERSWGKSLEFRRGREVLVHTSDLYSGR